MAKGAIWCRHHYSWVEVEAWKGSQGGLKKSIIINDPYYQYFWSCDIAQSAKLMYWNTSFDLRVFLLFISFWVMNRKMFSYSLYSTCWCADVLSPCYFTLNFLTLQLTALNISDLVGLLNWLTESQEDICLGMKLLSPFFYSLWECVISTPLVSHPLQSLFFHMLWTGTNQQSSQVRCSLVAAF